MRICTAANTFNRLQSVHRQRNLRVSGLDRKLYQGQYNPSGSAPHPPSLIFPLPMAAQPFTFGLKDSLIQQWNLTIERQPPCGAHCYVSLRGAKALTICRRN
jgi:hypothetical protein